MFSEGAKILYWRYIAMLRLFICDIREVTTLVLVIRQPKVASWVLRHKTNHS